MDRRWDWPGRWRIATVADYSEVVVVVNGRFHQLLEQAAQLKYLVKWRCYVKR